MDNLGGWLTTVVARVCLNMLSSYQQRREQPLDVHVPDPIISHEGHAHHPRGAYMMTATPNRQITAPMMSHRSGFSRHQVPGRRLSGKVQPPPQP